VIRIVVAGSECTGKSSLAAAIADALGAPWVPEFAREYAAAHQGPLSYEDVEAIARGQIAAEDRGAEAAAAAKHALLLLDTDLLSTIVYSHHYYGDCPGWIERAWSQRRADLYLLADIDVPWVPDGNQRDRGDRREQMQELFRAELRTRATRFAGISGNIDARLNAALAAVGTVLPESTGAD
jgi:NadR type nicotinamide-nucleotide adenylyltransferase